MVRITRPGGRHAASGNLWRCALARGRPRKPFEHHLLNGNPSHLVNAELAERSCAAVGSVGIPEMPKGLNAGAQRWFNKFAADAMSIRTLTTVDIVPLAGAAQAMAEWEDAQEIIEKFGLMIEEPVVNHKTGEVQGTKLAKNPAVAVSHAAWVRMKSFVTMLGLSPDSRPKIKTADEKKEIDPFEAMLDAKPTVGFAPQSRPGAAPAQPTFVNQDPRIAAARKLSPEYDKKCAEKERRGEPVTLF